MLVLAGMALAATILIPAGLIYDDLDRQQRIHVQGKVSALAARLETLPVNESRSRLQEILQREEPALRRLGLYDRRVEPPPVSEQDEPQPYRAVVPYRTARGMSIAEFELGLTEVDAIAESSRQFAAVAAIGGVLVFLLSLYGYWGAGRFAEAQFQSRIETIGASLAPGDRRALAILADPPEAKAVAVDSRTLFDRINKACGGSLVSESETVELATDPDLLAEALTRLAVEGSKLEFRRGEVGIAPIAAGGGLSQAAAERLIHSLRGTLERDAGAAKITLPV
ncbi:MAG: hypothetical protein SFV51_03435 [Bryobacteraceae bacterium]|nr:hypothetical protein [Bryobacteraceae bacterium]